MTLLKGLPPVLPNSPRLLILGSMPSAASLAAGEYYAHPRNAFWPLLAAVLDIAPPPNYAAKTAAAKRAGVAIWDVLAACKRAGSLDAAIEKDSETANDIDGLFARFPKIGAVALNGGRAKQCFMRHVQNRRQVPRLFLPSTSPANARMNFSQKLDAWRQIAPFVLREF